MKKQNEDFFTTQDLAVASVLVTLSFKLHHLERKGHKAVFFFPASDKIKPLVQSYWRQELTLDPHRLFECWKYLKNQIYNGL